MGSFESIIHEITRAFLAKATIRIGIREHLILAPQASRRIELLAFILP